MSSAIEKYKYFPATQELYITFVGGKEHYLYPNVPISVWHGLKRARSKGKYFNKFIAKQYSNQLIASQVRTRPTAQKVVDALRNIFALITIK